MINEINEDIKVYEGTNTKIPVNAWYVSVTPNPTSHWVSIIESDDNDRRETISEFSDRLNACVVINGGYFLMNSNPSKHVGLLKVDGVVTQPPFQSVIRNNIRYFTSRGTLGITKDQKMDIAWVSGRNDSLFEWKDPPNNSLNNPIKELNFLQAKYWDIEDAFYAGPVLIHNGKLRITTDEEVFFGSSIPDVHPRTAAGYTASGSMIFLVVDGRQQESRGVYLEELAEIMLGLGCIEAINLDGGGSSTLVVNGKRLNKPVGGTKEREVMSGIAVFCGNNE